MNIIVCVKQVPGTSNVVIDPETGALKRDGVESKLNPYDLYAIEQALQLRQAHGGRVIAISMGPLQAKTALLETIFMGVDQAYLICDNRFAGSDVLSTSRTLSQGILAAEPYDLIICGKQTTDGDTAQVGPEVAEFLGISSASNVIRIIGSPAGMITVDINLDDLVLTQQMTLPCLISVDREINTPRLPSLSRKWSINQDLVRILSLNDLSDQEECRYGLTGSPTQVRKIFPPMRNTIKEIYQGNHPADSLFELLIEKKLI